MVIGMIKLIPRFLTNFQTILQEMGGNKI